MNSTEVDDYDDYDDDYEDEYKDKKKDEKGGWFSNCIGCIVFIPGMTISLMIASYVLKIVIWVMEGLLWVIEFALKLIFVLIGEVFRYLSTILAIA